MKLQNTFLIFLSCFFLTLSVLGQTQSDFIIVANGNVENTGIYSEALQKANMNNFRLRDKRVKIIFDTGVEVELLSAVELASAGINISPENFPGEFPPNYKLPEFSLSESGIVLARYHTRNSK